MKAAVLYGGIGPAEETEREVSLASGAAVAAALRTAGHEVVPVEITGDGSFCLDGRVMPPAQGAGRLLERGVAAAFVALHGPYGEDGAIQGFLKVAQIPFTGPDVECAACAMNKHVTRLLLVDAGIPVPPGIFPGARPPPPRLPFDYPVFVKPCRLGSSVGVVKAASPPELEAGARAIVAMGQEYLVEAFLAGREYSVPVWDREDGPVALPVIEIRPDPSRPFFDYRAKYEKGQAEEIVLTGADPLLARLKELAIGCHRVLGCRSFSRTDFIVDETRGPCVLEINTIPGLTENSLLPKALRAVGFTLADLVTESLERAAETVTI
jgi:D-alanine-D-alanine ligase